MFRILTVLGCICCLVACSPTFDWRRVDFGLAADGVLPDAPATQTREFPFEAETLQLSMRSARAGDVLFALGAAPLPSRFRDDEAARARLARWATESFYRNLGQAMPDPAPAAGSRFKVQGQGPDGPVQIEAQVVVTPHEWLEAVVIAAPDAYARAPVGDFWLALHWPQPH